jgi:NFU1 iron-sulfur cluster scaffold homolog, mitochondrial
MISCKSQGKKMKIISVITTPNPDALKFTVDENLLNEGSKSFTSAGAAADDPLGKKLFDLAGVSSVFYMSNFVTINKDMNASWDDLESKILAVLREHELENSQKEPTEEIKKEAEARETKANYKDLSPAQKIIAIDKVLDDEIRPGLAGDGGGIEIVGLEENVLQVTYEGACGSCPSSTSGTLQFIENTLKNELDRSLTVMPV